MIIKLHFTSNIEAFTTVTMMNNIFWDVTLLSSGYTHRNLPPSCRVHWRQT